MKRFRIKSWSTYQHYGKRNPPWIKLHNETLHSRVWVSLDDASKALAIAIMLLASRLDNVIPFDPKYIQRVAYLDTLPNLDKLVEIDFIEEITSTDTDTEREKEHASKALASASKNKPKPKSTGKARTEFLTYCAEHDAGPEALDWETVLKKKRAAMTETAWRRRLNKLQSLAAQEPPKAIIARSADSGWTDLYERSNRSDRNGQGPVRETPAQRRDREARDALEAAGYSGPA